MTHELNVNVREGEQATVFILSGRLDYSTATKLRKAVRTHLKHPAHELVIDCGQLEYLDSMAMGTFLVIREQMQNEGKTVVLANCRGLILEALRLANFQKIFEMR